MPFKNDTGGATPQIRGLDVTFLRGDRALQCHLLALYLFKSTATLRARRLSDGLESYPLLDGWLRHRWRAQERRHAQTLGTCLAQIWPNLDQDVAAREFLHREQARQVEAPHPTAPSLLTAAVVERLARAAHCRMLAAIAGDGPIQAVFVDIGAEELSAARLLEQYYRAIGCESGHMRWVARVAITRTLFGRKNDSFRRAFEHSLSHLAFESRVRYRRLRNCARQALLAHFPFHDLAREAARQGHLPGYLSSTGAAALELALRMRSVPG